MMDSQSQSQYMDISSVVPETQPTVDSLDKEIETVREQIKQATQRRMTFTAALLSSSNSQRLLNRISSTPIASVYASTLEKRVKERERQKIHSQYRMCAGATMFESKDPDPNAVDEGRIIGVRIEAFSQRSKSFLPPYYLLLNRPDETSASLRVHRHTIPPSIPLSNLAARYLPIPTTSNLEKQKPGQKQDLTRFVRELRRELIAHHKRGDAVASLREQLVSPSVQGANAVIKSVDMVDAEGLDVRIEWKDGAVGRVGMEKDGSIKKVFVLGEDAKRRRTMERRLLAAGRVEGIAKKIVDD